MASAGAAEADQGAAKRRKFPTTESCADTSTFEPTNSMSCSMLTDMYQITMAYSYWFNGRHAEPACFDLFFRKNPFGGEFTTFCGLEEALRLVSSFRFDPSQIAYLQSIMPGVDPGFFIWLGDIDCSEVSVYALTEGTICFPRVPLLRVEGPLAICQMLETPLLNLVNFPSLVATCAARLKIAAGVGKGLLEFGARRAQGPDGALSASRYSYIGGFDGTSNVLAGMLYGMRPKGTHAHSFISSYQSLADLKGPHGRLITARNGKQVDMVELVLECAKQLKDKTGIVTGIEGELAAFIAYSRSYPANFLALVDTYDSAKSGLPNFLVVALALSQLGYTVIGIRLDSGDISYLSKLARSLFKKVALAMERPTFANFKIVASNDINEKTLESLSQQGHEVDVFGVGTNLVTCQRQPSLGCVYKLVEIGGIPRIKLSQTADKVSLPGKKDAYRLYNKSHVPVVDLLCVKGGEVPQVGVQILCKHPFDETKRCFIKPTRVVPLHNMVWGPPTLGEPSKVAAASDAPAPPKPRSQLLMSIPSIEDVKRHATAGLQRLRVDHRRLLNPTPYKVSITQDVHTMLHALWDSNVPITDMS